MVFFDTNVLIYRFDTRNDKKQIMADGLIQKHFANKTGIISTQVAQEFINVCLRKFSPAYSIKQVNVVIGELLEPMCQHTPDFLYYKKALKLYEESSISFYDALIVQAAIDTDCQILYSEDLQDGRKFGNLTIKNPF